MNATTDSTPEQRAIDKSRAIDPYLIRVGKLRAGEYQVLGQHGWYTVRVDASGYSCDCEGGKHGRQCWHKASCYRMRLACRALKPTPAPALTPGQQAKKDLWG